MAFSKLLFGAGNSDSPGSKGNSRRFVEKQKLPKGRRKSVGNRSNGKRGLSESDAESEIGGVCIVSHGAMGV